MVKYEIVKTSLLPVIGEKSRKYRVFAITSFTILWNCERIPRTAQFSISSRSAGVSVSQ
jgi:hypothetical protein